MIDILDVKELTAILLKGGPEGIGLTASTGSIQGGQPLVTSFNVIDTSGTAGDSVTLPAAANIGTVIFIKNGAAANSVDVFPALGDDLGAGANTAEALAAGDFAAYICTTIDSVWEKLLGGTA